MSFNSCPDHPPGQPWGQQNFLSQCLGLGQIFWQIPRLNTENMPYCHVVSWGMIRVGMAQNIMLECLKHSMLVQSVMSLLKVLWHTVIIL